MDAYEQERELKRREAESRHKYRVMLIADIVKGLEGFKPETTEERETRYMPNFQYHATHTDGRKLYFRFTDEGNKKRIRIAGNWPTLKMESDSYNTPRDFNALKWTEGGREEPPQSISVSPEKKPEQIARDIQNRYLPEYTRVFLLCLEGKKELEKYRDNKAKNRERLAKIDGVSIREFQNRLTLNFNMPSEHNARGELKQTAENSFAIELHSLTVKQAEKVLRLMLSLKSENVKGN